MNFPDPSQILPHTPPMRLVDEIMEASDTGVVCKTTIREDFVFLQGGSAEMVVCVELVAQAVGCYVGLFDLRRGDPTRPGFLAGCREATFGADRLYVGDELVVSVERRWIERSVASFSGTVTRAGAVVATVELTVLAAEPNDSDDGGES